MDRRWIYTRVEMRREIIEIQHIEQMLSFLDEKTHVFFDIDNTIIMPIHDFGSEHWENFLAKHFMSEGVPEKEAINRASHLWRAVQSVSEIQLVEEAVTAKVFNHVKEQGLPHFAITARSSDFGSVTRHQLESLNIHFPKHKHIYSLEHPADFSDGVFYCGDVWKAAALQAYIDIHSPSKIVMIDDNIGHLEKAVQLLPIEFIGLRYSHLDPKKKRYTPDPISKLLFKVFNHPIACKYLKNGLR